MSANKDWDYPWDSWRDGPHFSANYLRFDNIE
jgi:hypothetical protein